jgi:hypothetical protein
MRNGRRVGLHRTLPATRPRRRAIEVVDVDCDAEGRVRLLVMPRRAKGNTVVDSEFTEYS